MFPWTGVTVWMQGYLHFTGSEVEICLSKGREGMWMIEGMRNGAHDFPYAGDLCNKQCSTVIGCCQR
jgi:hypothetical protein